VLRFRSRAEEAAPAQEFLRACVSIATVFLPPIFAPALRSFSGLGDPQSAWPQRDFSSAKLFATALDLLACSSFHVLALALTPDLRFLHKAEGAGRVSCAELILQFVSVWFSPSARFSGSRIGFAIRPDGVVSSAQLLLHTWLPFIDFVVSNFVIILTGESRYYSRVIRSKD
jgi:hypothetical protein